MCTSFLPGRTEWAWWCSSSAHKYLPSIYYLGHTVEVSKGWGGAGKIQPSFSTSSAGQVWEAEPLEHRSSPCSQGLVLRQKPLALSTSLVQKRPALAGSQGRSAFPSFLGVPLWYFKLTSSVSGTRTCSGYTVHARPGGNITQDRQGPE